MFCFCPPEIRETRTALGTACQKKLGSCFKETLQKEVPVVRHDKAQEERGIVFYLFFSDQTALIAVSVTLGVGILLLIALIIFFYLKLKR